MLFCFYCIYIGLLFSIYVRTYKLPSVFLDYSYKFILFYNTVYSNIYIFQFLLFVLNTLHRRGGGGERIHSVSLIGMFIALYGAVVDVCEIVLLYIYIIIYYYFLLSIYYLNKLAYILKRRSGGVVGLLTNTFSQIKMLLLKQALYMYLENLLLEIKLNFV